jgi:hypothetical protein
VSSEISGERLRLPTSSRIAMTTNEEKGKQEDARALHASAEEQRPLEGRGPLLRPGRRDRERPDQRRK